MKFQTKKSGQYRERIHCVCAILVCFSKGELGLHALVLAWLDDLFGLVVALVEAIGRAAPTSVEISDILIKLSAMEAETDGFELVLRDELIESVDAVEVS